MPKFVSGSSGHIYAHDKTQPDNEDDCLPDEANNLRNQPSSKPSAINKRGTKEKQKNSLDLFKEELRKLQEEKQAHKNRLNNKTAQTPNGDTNLKSCETSPNIAALSPSSSSNSLKAQPASIPLPLKPDPRCPTALTLKVNLTPKDRDSSISGSYDTGDPNTTNLYVGNVNPTVNENDLCNIFGKFGPLASIKIMWPRTDEERARNRNSGFVAYMSRIDAQRALKSLNGKVIKGYDMKLGKWPNDSWIKKPTSVKWPDRKNTFCVR